MMNTLGWALVRLVASIAFLPIVLVWVPGQLFGPVPLTLSTWFAALLLILIMELAVRSAGR